MASEPSVEEQIKQLDQVKAVVAQDAAHYPEIVRGILPITQKPNVSLRRWCSSFFIDAFTSFSLDEEKKRALAVDCMETILLLLYDQDYEVQKNAITIAANVYGLGMIFVAEDESQALVWNQLVQIKTQVLKLWDSKHFGVESESIKFAQQVIILQLFGNRDPRLSGNSDFSLSSVPTNHALIHTSLEAEAQGLLDRLLGVFMDTDISAKSISATTFAISTLMKLRPATIPKCLKAVLSFNIADKMVDAATEKGIEMEFRVVEKALKILLQHVLNSSMAPKYNSQIQGYLASLAKYKNAEKRQAKTQISKQDPPKRVKIDYNPMPPNSSTVVPSGPYSYASLYSLLEKSNPLLEFNTKTLPLDMALNITLAGIASANPILMKNSIDIVKSRYENFLKQKNSRASGSGANSAGRAMSQDPRAGFNSGFTNGLSQAVKSNTSTEMQYSNGGDNDDSDYDPSETSSQQVQIRDPRNSVNFDAQDEIYESEEDMSYLQPAASFSLPPPEKLSNQDRLNAIKNIITRMISYDKVTTSLQALPSGAANANKGIDRVAITEWTRNTWVILVSRLLTRGVTGPSNQTNELSEDKSGLSSEEVVSQMSKSIRESIFAYAMENFRERLDIIIEWLNEEWFGEFVQHKKGIASGPPKGDDLEESKPTGDTKFSSKSDSVYFQYTARILDNITPFLTKSDRPQFLRLLSDLPELDESLVYRLKSLCIDPERRDLGMFSLL